MAALTGTIDDPVFRRERARKAALARTTIDAHIAALERDICGLTPNDVARLAEMVYQWRKFNASTSVMHCDGQRTIDDHFRENGTDG